MLPGLERGWTHQVKCMASVEFVAEPVGSLGPPRIQALTL